MNRCLIIAEAGVNHNGSLSIAKQLILAAKEAGADFIKFQTFQAKHMVSKTAPKANYQIKNTHNQESQLTMLQKLELTKEMHDELHAYCKQVGIGFLSTAFDSESVDLLSSYDMPLWKIPSGELTNLPLLERIAMENKPILLSTGMATMDEIGDAITVLRQYCFEPITLLHCTTQYPTPMDSVNLKAMSNMQTTFQVEVGYSDHTKGIHVPIAAVALGATVIEKHFTLDKTMEGPDHIASLEPDELKCMISAIRDIEIALGSGEKAPVATEQENIAIARKSIVAKRQIKQGELLTSDNITTKRPGTGISPMHWYEYLGTAANRDYVEDELIDP